MRTALGISAVVVVFAAVLGVSGVLLWQLAEQRGRVAQGMGNTPPQGPAPTPFPVPPKVEIAPPPGSTPAPKIETSPRADSSPEAAPTDLQDPAISVRPSAISSVIVGPLTLKGFPPIREAWVTQVNKKYNTVQVSRKLGETMIVEPGTYDIWLQPDEGDAILIKEKIAVKERGSVVIEPNLLVGAFLVRDASLAALKLNALVATLPGKRYSVEQRVRKIDVPLLVPAGKALDILVEPAMGNAVILARGLSAQPGELVVVGGAAGAPAPALTSGSSESAASAETSAQDSAGSALFQQPAPAGSLAPAGPAARSKWNLPKHYDELGLSDDQKDRVTRVVEAYNPQIDDRKRKLEVLSKTPLLSNQIFASSLALKKLINDRQNLLHNILTEEQRERYRTLSRSDHAPVNPSAKASPQQNPAGGADVLNVTGTLTDKDPFDKLRRDSHCKVFQVELRADRLYTIDLRSQDLDCYLRIEDADGNALAGDDDSGGDLNARLQFRPKRSGAYRIIATTFDAETGGFTLTVRSQFAPAEAPKFKTLGKLKT